MRKIFGIALITVFLTGCFADDLHYQVAVGNNEQAKALINQGKSLESLDYNGTPLCAAALTGNVEMAKYLIERGANVNGGNAEGYFSRSPLHSVAGGGSVEIAKLLLANGANTQTRNRENLTPLQTAEAENHPEVAQLLREFELVQSSWKQTESINTSAAYQSFIDAHPDSPFEDEATKRIADLQEREAVARQQQQKLEELEAKLPPTVRRDKYMVQLSGFLKAKNYSEALKIFPKLDALPIAKDPSLDFFYAESLLRTGKPSAALEKLYKYIAEQGSGATHYARALELINQAESQL